MFIEFGLDNEFQILYCKFVYKIIHLKCFNYDFILIVFVTINSE